jgi:hypothetical protein
MGIEEARFNDLDKSLNVFLHELQKQPITEIKKREIEQKIQEVIQINQAPALSNDFEKELHKKNSIQLDMKQLNRNTSLLHSSHIQQTAVRWASGLALFSAGILFITIGFILIVTPASPEFEIATIFYFNDHDGFTVMDLFALVIIFIGIYLFIRAFIDKNK